MFLCSTANEKLLSETRTEINKTELFYSSDKGNNLRFTFNFSALDTMKNKEFWLKEKVEYSFTTYLNSLPNILHFGAM